MNASKVTFVEGIGEIDTGIACLVRALNQAGYKTSFSCSGLWSEHQRIEGAVSAILVDGYIRFSANALTGEQSEAIIQAANCSGMSSTRGLTFLSIQTPTLPSIPEASIYWESLQAEAVRLSSILGRSKTPRAQKRRYHKILRSFIIQKGNPAFDEVILRSWRKFQSCLLGT